MTIETKKQCPQWVREKLLEWEERGWITINHEYNDAKEKDTHTPQRISPKENQSTKPKELIWCERQKSIAKSISENLNHQEIKTKTRGIAGSYIFEFDSEGFCNMMDELYKNHKRYITDYLHGTNKPTGATLIFPFLGEMINAQIFNQRALQKTDLEEVLRAYGYNTNTAIKKLSSKGKLDKNQDAKLLIEIAKTLGKRIKNAE